MCGIGTGKSQRPGMLPEDVSSSSSALIFSGILELSSTALPATAARPKKLRRDNAATNLEAGEVFFIRCPSFLLFRLPARIVFLWEWSYPRTARYKGKPEKVIFRARSTPTVRVHPRHVKKTLTNHKWHNPAKCANRPGPERAVPPRQGVQATGHT